MSLSAAYDRARWHAKGVIRPMASARGVVDSSISARGGDIRLLERWRTRRSTWPDSMALMKAMASVARYA
jgi:hypothetical protein